MSELIEAILTLSRITREQVKRERVDMSELALEIAGELKNGEPGRDVEFIIPDGIVASADARMAIIVRDNLFGNAWKFAGKHPTARIELGTERQDGEQVFFVRDDGAGFDMKYAGKLFKTFQRLHTTDEFEGIGIGLATVMRIINMHGGRIWAKGEVEKGATFYFTLESRDE